MIVNPDVVGVYTS